MDDFIEKPKGSRLKNILSLIMIAIISIGALYLFYQNKVIQKANQALEILAATTISTNISTDGTLSVGGSATTSGSYYIGNDLTVESGSVGIGTTTPINVLQVAEQGTVDRAPMRIDMNLSQNIGGSEYRWSGIDFVTQGYDLMGSTGNYGWRMTAFNQITTEQPNRAGDLIFWHYNGAWNSVLTLDDSANVGINTTTPDAVLSVTASAGDLTGDQMLFTVASTTRATSNDYLTVTADGNVGIGTVNPWEILTIANDGDADFDISVAQNSNPSNSPSQHFRLSDGTHAVPLIAPADEEIGKIEWEYYDGTAFRDGASINVVIDGTPAAGSSPAYFQFKTTPSGSTASVERMRITSGGNVGIGTTTPNALFSVASSTATTTVFFDSGATTKGACFKLKDNDGGGYTYCSVNDGTMSCSTDSCE